MRLADFEAWLNGKAKDGWKLVAYNAKWIEAVREDVITSCVLVRG